jgi:tetratricopeptide (TPR) repeat protein
VTVLVPDNVRGHSNLAAALQLQGQDAEAEVELEKSIAIRPTAAALNNLGVLRFYGGRYADAARAFERALALDALDYRVWQSLGAAYWWSRDERPKAAEAYRRALEIAERQARVNANDAELLVFMADCHAMLENGSAARDRLRRALALAPERPSVSFVAAQVCERLGDRRRALDYLARAIAQGYSLAEVARDPTLAELRQDPRYRGVVAATPTPHESKGER